MGGAPSRRWDERARDVRTDPRVENLLRAMAPQVLGGLVRRYGQFEECEHAVQEALLAAAIQWPAQGVPENPRAWLTTVASRRLTDQVRSDHARRRREATVSAMAPTELAVVAGADDLAPQQDDTLTLLFMCCHPAVSPPSQPALTLRAVGGLTTAQIAAAFLVPEATMAQRIGRAKQRIKATGIPFQLPPPAERDDRLRVVLHVLYLIFNEGYTASSGPDLHRSELTGEASGTNRARWCAYPARRPGPKCVARRIDKGGVSAHHPYSRPGTGGAVPDPGRDRAVHCEAAHARDTDWSQIVALYDLLMRMSPNPMIALNHVVAAAMAREPRAGLELLDQLVSDNRIAGHHRLDAVRAHLLEMAGEIATAQACYRRAARRTTSLPERRYLESRVARLGGAVG
jgi:predicted RNA polymerase sigma factor